MDQLSPVYQEIFKIISKQAYILNQEVYVVGGIVRDYFLDPNNIQSEVDITCSGSGLVLAQRVADVLNIKHVIVYKQFGTARFDYQNICFEFVGMRKESYRKNSRKPIVENASFIEDIQRRDLTINTLTWSLNRNNYGTLIDTLGGIQDIQKKRLKTPIDPIKTFNDDPLRMLRTIRFASQLNFSIEKNTYEAMKLMKHRLKIVSMERITQEVQKIMITNKPSIGWVYLFKTELLNEFFPELPLLHGVKERMGITHKDNFWHTMKVLDNVAQKSNNLWLRWAALLHDIAKPDTQRFIDPHGWTFHGHDIEGAKKSYIIFKRLKLPMGKHLKYVQKLVRLHLRPIALVDKIVTDSAIRRLIVDAGDELQDLMLLCRMDITSKNIKRVKEYHANFDIVEKKIEQVMKKDKLRNWKNPITGNDIMTLLDIPPSPIIGKIKHTIKEAILSGDINNNKDEALQYIKKRKNEWIKT